jgi:hypothetical protein
LSWGAHLQLGGISPAVGLTDTSILLLLQVSGDQVVSFAALEEALQRSEARAHQTLHQSTRRLDELAGQAEMLAEGKMDRAESISRQYLEKSVGEISMEFAAALQRHRQEINRYLNDKAQADVLMDMEGRFGARLQQVTLTPTLTQALLDRRGCSRWGPLRGTGEAAAGGGP